MASPLPYQAWDLGGHDTVRHLWDEFLPDTHAVVFMVDSADSERLVEVAEELGGLLEDKNLAGAPIAVLFNKADMEGSLPEDQLREELGWGELEKAGAGPFASFRCSVVRDEGYVDAFQWLSQYL